MLEGEANRRIDDEQPDDKGQQAERRQVEVKAVGEAFKIALRIRFDQPKLVADDIFERCALALGVADQEPGNLIRLFQELLRRPDIDHQHTRHELRLDAQRRQQGAAACLRRRAFRQLEIGKHLGRDQRFSRRRKERLQVSLSDRGRIAYFGGQRYRFDSQ